MKILYFNNCWFTNVGEAFIDLGGMELIKKLIPEAKIACISAMSDYYIMAADKKEEQLRWRQRKILRSRQYMPCRMNMFIEADYVVLPGMVGTAEYLKAASRKMIDDLVSRGCRLVLLGLGGYEYSVEEKEKFTRYLDEVKPALVLTRDRETYENYRNVAPCVNGIDCAFWVKDVFNPTGFGIAEYDIVAFNRSTEPESFSSWKYPIIRPWHMQYDYSGMKYKDNILISDTPYDYLTAYANAHRVYTDLVHASIISIMYGVPVKYWYVDKRSMVFDVLDGLERDEEGWMSLTADKLEKDKNKVYEESRKILAREI